MNIQLIEGEFVTEDALMLVAQLIHAKIKYHESKIDNSHSEEDIKARETKIKRLQKELFEFRNDLGKSIQQFNINASINVSQKI
jgi:hypothetical protein